MRLAVLALSMVLASGCEAVVNFNNFTFERGVDLGSGGEPDLAPAPFGAACSANGCAQNGGASPTMCESTVAGGTFPDGICTRPCSTITPCIEFPDAMCAPAYGAAYCFQKCGGTTGVTCRTGWVCCPRSPGSVCLPADACK